MYRVEDLYHRHAGALQLEIICGEGALKREISSPEVQRPGISLVGYFKKYESDLVVVFGHIELLYLKDLDKETRRLRISQVISPATPAVIVCKDCLPPKELVDFCKKEEIPLFCSPLKNLHLISKLTFFLSEDFSLKMTCHGTLIEAYGVGVLIQGESSVGKSEAALSLIERGHRLVADDIVQFKVHEATFLLGTGLELSRHLMEIRGIGIINVAQLYGAVCVRESKLLDLVVKLEEWNDKHFYDRVGLEEKSCDILGIKIPYHVLPVKPGRDVALLIETLVLNHRLKKEKGYNSAKEFKMKLMEAISEKSCTTA